jgi:hypothetical protein
LPALLVHKPEALLSDIGAPCHKLRAETTDCQKTFRVDGSLAGLFLPIRRVNAYNGLYQIGPLKTKNAPAAIKAKPIKWLSVNDAFRYSTENAAKTR